MKVLSIGNSFSQDSHKWLHKLAEKNGVDVETANLYVGGCSLERHWNNVLSNNPEYALEMNGSRAERYVSIEDALGLMKWDVVTLQQASPLSGRPQSYFPYLQNLANYVTEKQPDSKIYFVQTWSYEIDRDSSAFNAYNRDQREMFRRIVDASEMASKVIDAPIIPVGEVIQTLRETLPEFDYKNGGMSLNRDGFHLSLDYGRFAAAATWFCKLTQREIKIDGFEDFDLEILNKIVKVTESIVFPSPLS